MTMGVPYTLLLEGVRLLWNSISGEKKVTLKVDTSYAVEVKVVARLGQIGVTGVKVKVGGQDFGISDAEGEIKEGNEQKRKKVTENKIEIIATYENKIAGLRKEQVTLSLSEIAPGEKKAKGQAKHTIEKLHDATGEAKDVDFMREYDAVSDLAWSDVRGARVLSVTLKLSTFSLAVPYMNQNESSDTVMTRPGLQDGKDPETASHEVKNANGNKFKGSVLCYPTSMKMLLGYWGQTATRGEVMQKFYDMWADSKFGERKDKTAGAPSPTPPVSPTEGQYWLDSTPGDAAGFTLKRAVFKMDWDTLEGTEYTAKTEGNEPPKKPHVGDIWKDTSGAAPAFKKAVKKFESWRAIDEEDWRVSDRGAKVWQWGGRATLVFAALKPTGAGYTATDKPLVPDTVEEMDPVTQEKKSRADLVPLTRILDESAQSDLKKIDDKYNILDKYKEWLKNGWPFIIATQASAHGHMMVARGAVVNEKDEIEWLIVNDPYGNLEGKEVEDSSYIGIEINKSSGEGSERGKHAYYRNQTSGAGSKLRITAGGRGFPRIEKAMTAGEIAAKLVQGA